MYGELKRAIHLDFHTMPGIYNFNQNWDAAAFAERLEKSHVKYINAFAECNLGFAYFDTKIGVKYPGMKGDMFGDLLRECHKRDIGVTAYFNLGIDHEACRRHRDWMKVNKDGNVLWGDRTSNGFRLPCYETGYGEYQYGMIKELLELHPEVDGIFLDCINFMPCYGNECLEAIKAKGGDPTNDDDVKKHTYDSVMNFLARVKKLIGKRNMICNSQPYWMMRHFNSHVEVECLPGVLGWNYDYFVINAAYARQIKEKVLYMSGRFQASWGDLGGLKTYESLEHDMFDALMNGVECSIGDHMHPAEIIDESVYNNVEKVYEKIMTYEPWTNTAKYNAEIGILCPIESRHFGAGPFHGIARMFGELKYTFDVLNEEMDLSKYKLLVLPDGLRLTEALKEKVAAHIAAGKLVLSCGEGGLNQDGTDFALPEYKFTFAGIDTSTQAYYKYDDDQFRYAVYVPGIKFYPGADSHVIAEYYKAYFNREWDGFHGFFYLPPEKATGHAMAAVSGKIAHIGFNVFTAYNQNAYIAHKKLVRKCLDAIGFEPTISTDLPSTSRVTITSNPTDDILHVKVTYAESRGQALTIEEHVKYPAGAKVTVKGKYTNAVIIPSGEKADAVIGEDEITITLPQIEGYMALALTRV